MRARVPAKSAGPISILGPPRSHEGPAKAFLAYFHPIWPLIASMNPRTLKNVPLDPLKATMDPLMASLEPFFGLPGYGDSAASDARGVSRTGQIPMQRTMGHKGSPAQQCKPDPHPWCPVGNHPTRLGHPAPHPLRPPASDMQARLRTSVPTPQDST